jgi:hypothetical protein
MTAHALALVLALGAQGENPPSAGVPEDAGRPGADVAVLTPSRTTAPGGGPLIIEVPPAAPSARPQPDRAQASRPAGDEPAVASSGTGAARGPPTAEARTTVVKETRDASGGKVQVVRDPAGVLIELVSDADGYLVSIRALGPEKGASQPAAAPCAVEGVAVEGR